MAERNPAERITVTLPKPLYQRLQLVKENFNVSALCQEAIEYAVSIEENRMNETLSKKEKVIERLRLEQQKSQEEWFDCGKVDGLKDVDDFSFEDFRQLSDLYDSKHELEMHGFWLTLDQFPEDFHEMLQRRIEQYSPKPIEESYLAGWIEGVIDFWDEIKGEI